jgi:hypothetical protein
MMSKRLANYASHKMEAGCVQYTLYCHQDRSGLSGQAKKLGIPIMGELQEIYEKL